MVLATAAAALTIAAPVWGTPVDSGMLPAAASAAIEVLPVDLNGDGLLDVVVAPLNGSQGDLSIFVAPVFLLNRGAGKFVDATQDLFNGPAPPVDWARELLTADFNRDGRADIFIADHGHANDSNPNQVRPGGQDHLFLSAADGHFADATTNLPQQFSFTHSAAVADVNGDGAPDIFENNIGCCVRDPRQAEILLNDGAGHFSVEPDALRGFITDIYGQDHSYACLFTDANGDGSPDLVVGGSEEQGATASQVLLNDGHGRFTFFTTLPPTTGPPNNAFVIDMKAADVNGDGHVDLVFGETLNDPFYIGTTIQVLINDGTAHFADETAARLQSPPTQAKSWPQRVLLTDINDDGHPDLTIQYAPQGAVLNADPTAVYVNDDGIFKPVPAPKDGYGLQGGGIAWVNGDGPHALFSVEFHPLGQAASHYYVAPQIVAPAAPTHVRMTRVGTSIRVSWSQVAGATRYEVVRNHLLIAKTSATTFVDRRPGKHPTYAVRAANAAGTSP
jgi:hypothetical protein